MILWRRNLCFCSGFKPIDELGMRTTVYLCLINNKVLLKMKCSCSCFRCSCCYWPLFYSMVSLEAFLHEVVAPIMDLMA